MQSQDEIIKGESKGDSHNPRAILLYTGESRESEGKSTTDEGEGERECSIIRGQIRYR